MRIACMAVLLALFWGQLRADESGVPPEWVPIPISKEQALPQDYSAAEGTRLERTKCVEAVLTESGLDPVTESQFSLIVDLALSEAGEVTHFRLLKSNPFPKDLRQRLSNALERWTFRPLEPSSFHGACLRTVLTKVLGATTTSACGQDGDTSSMFTASACELSPDTSLQRTSGLRPFAAQLMIR